MSDTKCEDDKEETLDDSCDSKSTVNQDNDEQSLEDPKTSESGKQDPVPCPEEEAIKKKYGGLAPKKPPLISKDHDHAFFDSADWALGKQGAQKSKGPLHALRPKLQPTPQQQIRSRRSAYAHASDDSEGDATAVFLSTGNDCSNTNCTLSKEDQSNTSDEFSDDNFHPDDQTHQS